MEERGSPSVREVITKLKSDGTFDNFRKSCVSSIENEVCVRIILIVLRVWPELYSSTVLREALIMINP